jgi:hypothetical protein
MLATGLTATDAAGSSSRTDAPSYLARLTDSTYPSGEMRTNSRTWRTSSVAISFGSALATSSTCAGRAVTASPEPTNTATRIEQEAFRPEGMRQVTESHRRVIQGSRVRSLADGYM